MDPLQFAEQWVPRPTLVPRSAKTLAFPREKSLFGRGGEVSAQDLLGCILAIRDIDRIPLRGLGFQIV